MHLWLQRSPNSSRKARSYLPRRLNGLYWETLSITYPDFNLKCTLRQYLMGCDFLGVAPTMPLLSKCPLALMNSSAYRLRWRDWRITRFTADCDVLEWTNARQRHCKALRATALHMPFTWKKLPDISFDESTDLFLLRWNHSGPIRTLYYLNLLPQ